MRGSTLRHVRQSATGPMLGHPVVPAWRAIAIPIQNAACDSLRLASAAVAGPSAPLASAVEHITARAPWRAGGFALPREVVCLSYPPRGDAAPRTSLLLISIDTARADHLGCYGYDRATSPFLDRFAETAVRFGDYSAVAPYTLPTHATMFTGLLPLRHGAVDYTMRLDSAAIVYFPALMARRGYATAAFTGGGYVSQDFGFDRGFDRFVSNDPILPKSGIGVPVHRSAAQQASLDDVASWIEDRGAEPFFLFLHTYAAHNYFVPREHFALFDSGTEGGWRDTLDDRPRPALVDPENPPTGRDVRYLRDLYDAGLHYVDQELGAFFDRLDAIGALDHTICVITSDHGEEFWEHGGIGHSVSLYQEQLRIPLLIRLPRGERGARVLAEPTTQADLLPTLLELLNLPPAPGIDGVSRAALVRSNGDAGGSTALLAHIETDNSRRLALRIGRFKVIQGDTSDSVGFPARAPLELYDLEADPAEAHDLAGRDSTRVRELQAELRALESKLRASALGDRGAGLSEEVLKQLRELGYLR